MKKTFIVFLSEVFYYYKNIKTAESVLAILSNFFISDPFRFYTIYGLASNTSLVTFRHKYIVFF